MGYLNSVLSSSGAHLDDSPVSGGGLSQDGKFSYGYASSPGKRSSMEDFYETKICGVDGEIVGLFGVFDGHGGARAAEYVKKNLFSNLIRHPKFITDTKSAIADAYNHTDSEFLKSENNQNRDAGSTASTAVLVGNRLVVANVGDSRAVICRGGNAIAVSRDHKPDQSDERQRIEDAGGFVMWAGTWRVGGVLAVSRAFGDRLLKQYVVADPEIKVISGIFVILAKAPNRLYQAFRASRFARGRGERTPLCPKEKKMAARIGMRSIFQTLSCRTKPFVPLYSEAAPNVHLFHRYSTFATSATAWRLPFATGISGRRWFSADVSQLPRITDPYVERPFKDFMAASWDELPDAVISDAKEALSKTSEDKSGQEALANVFRAAEAVEEFGGVLVSLRMELDERSGLSGEKVAPLPDELKDALHAVYRRYTTYLDAFSPEETYLRKKVEMELGTKMIHIKMRCSGLDSDWGKITVLGTSGLSGSYVEQRS